MSLVVYLNSVNSTKFDQPMYTVIHMQDPGSVLVNQDHGSLAPRVGSRVSVADPVPSLGHGENTPYFSSELNESDIVNRQNWGDKLKYILKLYIGVHVT